MIYVAKPGQKRAVYDLMCRLMNNVSHFVPWSQAAVANEIDNAVDMGRCLVAERDGKIVGSLGYDIAPPWYVSEPVIQDRWLCAEPGIGGFLVKRIREIGKALDLPVFIGVSGPNHAAFDKRFEPVARLYRVR